MSSVFSLSAAAVDSIVFLINDIFEKGDPKPDRLFFTVLVSLSVPRSVLGMASA